MPSYIFLPSEKRVEVKIGDKIVFSACEHKIPMRYGCVSCRCGTCAVEVDKPGNFSPMDEDERQLLARMQLPTDGSVRLGCQAKIAQGEVRVDLAFQKKYSPSKGMLGS